jgi:putative DNA primase/helicase
MLTTAFKVNGVVSMTRSHVRVAILFSQFDKDPFLLNTPAGAVDLRTAKIRPATREDYFTRTTPVRPRNIVTPVFNRFMRDIMGAQVKPNRCGCAACLESAGKPEQERRRLHLKEVARLAGHLLRVYGYCLTGDVSEDKLFIQKGEGGNGKGTLNDFMSRSIYGRQPDGYATEIPTEALLEQKVDRHPTELMDLWGSRLAMARESNENARWNEDRVKRLTGRDRIKARYMRQDFIEFDPTHKLLVFLNDMPMLRGGDQASWRRRLQITIFPQLWADEADEETGVLKRDTTMGAQLDKEAEGVLWKLIRAGKRWYRDRDLKAPQTVLQASNKYLAQQSRLKAFIDDRLDTSDPNETVTVNEIWPVYVKWCEEMNEHPCKRTQFNDLLERSGIRIGRTKAERGICRGVKLKVRNGGDG